MYYRYYCACTSQFDLLAIAGDVEFAAQVLMTLSRGVGVGGCQGESREGEAARHLLFRRFFVPPQTRAVRREAAVHSSRGGLKKV